MNNRPKPTSMRSALKKRWKKIAAILVISLILLVIGIAVFIPINPKLTKNQLESESQNELARIAESSKVKHQKKLSELLSGSAASNSNIPIYSAIYDSCYTDHSDAGIFAQSYNYKCQLSYVDVIELGSVDSLVYSSDDSVLSADGDIDEQSPFLYLHLPGSPIPHFEDNLWTNLYIKPSNTIASIKDIDNYPSIVIADPVIAYAVMDAYAKRTLLEEQIRAEFDSDKNYLVYSVGHQYFTKSIGCSPTSTFICNSPLSKN